MPWHKKATTYVTVIAVALVGAILLAPRQARAAQPGDGGGGDTGGGISAPWFGLGAVAVIATIAIWQGVKDAQKKKQTKKEKEREIEEEKEFEEYFESDNPDDATALPGTAEVAPPGVPAPETVAPPVDVAP